MKRKRSIFLLVLAVLFLFGTLVLTVKIIPVQIHWGGDFSIYSTESTVEDSLVYLPENLEKMEEKNTDKRILSSGKNHKLFDLTEEYIPEYLYEIYNNSGEIVKSETMVEFPTITYPSGSLLSIEWGAGTGVYLAEYYDINKDLFSDTYQCPLAVQGYKVAYVEHSDDFIDGKLVISDIFDRANYYKEFYLDDMSSITTPVSKVEFIDQKEVKVSYFMGEDNEEKTKILQLN